MTNSLARPASTGRRRPAAAPPSAETRLLEAAEALFARHGYNGVSIRDIAAAASANISSVYYHFGSKQKLLEAVCRRRMVPVVAERAAAMEAVRKAAPQPTADGAAASAAVTALIAAFVGPTLRAAQGRSRDSVLFRRLAGHLATDPTPEVRRAIRAIYDETVRDFLARLKEAYKDAAPDGFFWGMVCALGAAVYVQSDLGHFAQLLGRGGADLDAEAGLAHITRFIRGGLDAAARG